ncbi:MAG: sigma-70 family RNA polymerase sigma factor [Acidobacteria bacterium]|nr:MAG: sigma-70 family RNA polymerase sigma factor [Acidobacteriota bacterium]
MADQTQPEITRLLLAWEGGDGEAFDKLIPLVYPELRRLAHRYMSREAADHTLQTTALIHEAYLRLIGAQEIRWQNRAHFFAISAQLMRRILVDFARRRLYQKRGGDVQKIPIADDLAVSAEPEMDLLRLDDALAALATFSPRQAKVIELRYFGGLDVAETAEVLKISEASVLRDWRLARAWLRNELNRSRRKETRDE